MITHWLYIVIIDKDYNVLPVEVAKTYFETNKVFQLVV